MNLAPAPRFEPLVDIDSALLRQRVVDRIVRAVPAGARLTFLTAPAGFGKTTVLAQLARLRRAAGVQVAWLNCDERDKDARLFSSNLLAALARCHLQPGAGPLRTLPLATRLAQVRDELLICVDEFEAASSDAVDELIEQLALSAPPHVSLVLASREAPNRGFTRLHLAGRVRLVDADLLRFTRDEAMALLLDALTEADAALIALYADGWPFALQLARLRALGQHDASAPGWELDPRAKIPRRQIFDFLAEEVVATLPPAVFEFLGDVAVLEVVDVAAANALRERDDSLSLIRQLARLKPIVVVDDSLQRVRLHPLLRDYLCDAMTLRDPSRIAGQHLRAAHHLADTGHTHEAVSHAVAAGRLDVAADLIERAGALRLVANEGALRSRLLLGQLPEAHVRRRPRLRLLHLACEVVEMNPAGAMTEFERIESQVRDAEGAPDEPLQLDLEMARCLMLLQQAEHQSQFSPWPVLAHTTRVARAQLGQDPRLLAISLPLEIFFLHRYGPVERCERRTREIEAIHADGNYTYNSPWIWMYRARNALARGQVDQAERDLRHSLHNDANYINYRQDSLGQLVAILLGRIAYLRGDMELALSHVGALLSERPITMLEMLVGAHVDVAVCEFALGNVEHSLALLTAACHQAEDEDLPLLGAMAGLTQIDLAARMGDPTLLARLAVQYPPADWWAQACDPFALPWCVVEAAARAQHAVLRQAGDGSGALAVAETFLALARGSGHQLAVLAAHLMAVTAGDDGVADLPRAAQQHLEQALQLAITCGVVQPFLDAGAIAMNRLRQWLGSVPTNPPAPAEVRAWACHIVAVWELQFRSRAQRTAASTLTPRELDVLGQLAQQHSTKLIARALMLSPETIKHHLKGIYAKLAVSSRDDAVAEARRRALIP